MSYQSQAERQQSVRTVEDIYHQWDEALGAKDVDAAVALYAPDATLESPLVCYLLKRDVGTVRGREELRSFLRMVFARTPPTRGRFRTGYFTDGKTLMWEYPRQTPAGEQMDFVEVMRVENGLIQHHRVYWGWFGFKTLERDQYRR
jgi:ketosteroid isomerase-like protein